ncbi:uncharacterized protein LOC143363151 [Halictus rubicundus]|uniref:uncharacterized protein LOC143363151 n=1 Tax=Halictus rubicundus TaxID=77578 RepID=UPI0040367B70
MWVQRKRKEKNGVSESTKNIKHEYLVESENVILPPLHIKLGIMKNFVKAMDKTGPAFEYLKTKFPTISDAKIKEGIFIGPQIRKLINDTNFNKKLNKLEKRLGCNMSLKMHFLHSHLDFFPANLGDVSDEHGERFHQDISTMEKRYKGKDLCAILLSDSVLG